MQYLSTRDASLRKSASEAIAMGLSRDGGLYTPVSFPRLPDGALEKLMTMTYPQRAAYVMKLFLDEYTEAELLTFANRAYAAPGKFDDVQVAPVVALGGATHMLELWHGPTCAFKDMALQMLPQLLTASLGKIGETRTVCILVATSGDTGKAALEGFRDVAGTRILVFYPKDGVSEIQQLQMVTQEGDNVGVCAVVGNFDDAQTGVKRIFSDESMHTQLDQRGCFLSSANSINWGRILPQVVYYISAYCDLVKSGSVCSGEPVNFCVPTGNFGNILAGYFARLMGLPVGRLICASNENNVLTDFIATGVYDRNRPFYTTSSPSMDILISSNLERLLYLLSGSDEQVRSYMHALSETGRYTISPALLEQVQSVFSCGWCDSEKAAAEIAAEFSRSGYLMDPHTAVASAVLREYRETTGDNTPTVIVSTASPFKFCSSVLDALGEHEHQPGTAILAQLSKRTGKPVPAPLAALAGKPVRFTQAVEKEQMAAAVLEMLR